jgi:hypothetical protein
MGLFAKLLTNAAIIALGVWLLPAISITSLLFPFLAWFAVSMLITNVHPNLLDTDEHMIPLHLFFVTLLLAFPLLMIAAVATPGIELDGFIPVLVLSVLVSISNAVVQIRK